MFVQSQRFIIQLEKIHKSFVIKGLQVPVLKGVDFCARESEFVGVIGPSGCGKSTLLNIIAGLENPDSGKIELDGIPTKNRLGQVGYMQQKDLLMPWRTVIDNVLLGLEIRGVPRTEARQRAMKYMDTFGLKGFEEEYPSSLSGGMRQRAAFLRTLLAGNETILLDEPFGALDALTRSQMQEWILNRCESLHKTIILITHDVDEAVLLCDRVYVLTPRPGKVKLIQDIELPRPRTYQTLTDERFVKIKAQLLHALREETPVEPL